VIRQDTAVLNKYSDFDAREDTEVLRMRPGGGFDIREDTEVLRLGTGAAASLTGGFAVLLLYSRIIFQPIDRSV
jgi:hypothetical protein